MSEFLKSVLELSRADIPFLAVLALLLLAYGAPALVQLLGQHLLESHKARLSERQDRRNKLRAAVRSLHSSLCDAVDAVDNCFRFVPEEQGASRASYNEAIRDVAGAVERSAIDLPPRFCDLMRNMVTELNQVAGCLAAADLLAGASQDQLVAKTAESKTLREARDMFYARVKPLQQRIIEEERILLQLRWGLLGRYSLRSILAAAGANDGQREGSPQRDTSQSRKEGD